MSEGFDWKEGGRAEYRSKRAELTKKITAAERAERKAGERVNALNRQLEDLEAGARAFGLDDLPQMTEEMVVEAIAIRDGTQASAKDIILDALAGRSPMKAKELKTVIEAKLGRPVHYKTPGMTLYRLAEDGLVQRNFHDWSLTEKGRLTMAAPVASSAALGDPEAMFDDYEPADPADEPLDFDELDEPPEPHHSEVNLSDDDDDDPGFVDDYLRAKGRSM